MIREEIRRTALLGGWVFLCLLVAPVGGQESEAPSEQPPVEEPAADDGLGFATTAPSEADQVIEDFLTRDSAAVIGAPTYDPGDRRDPFRSLERAVEATREERPRPPGIPGLLIDELVITGIWVGRSGPVAQVQAPDNPVSILLHEGDQLFDGDVVRITYRRGEGGEVEFRQETEPGATRPYQTKTLKLRP